MIRVNGARKRTSSLNLGHLVPSARGGFLCGRHNAAGAQAQPFRSHPLLGCSLFRRQRLCRAAPQSGYFFGKAQHQPCKIGRDSRKTMTRLFQRGIKISRPADLQLHSMNTLARGGMAIQHIAPCIRAVVRHRPATPGQMVKHDSANRPAA